MKRNVRRLVGRYLRTATEPHSGLDSKKNIRFCGTGNKFKSFAEEENLRQLFSVLDTHLDMNIEKQVEDKKERNYKVLDKIMLSPFNSLFHRDISTTSHK